MATLTAAVRMYRFNELGDCFLVTFREGDAVSRLLVDCGSFRNSGTSQVRLRQIVADIARESDGVPLDVVIGTHQHNDHVSGFVHCTEEFKEIGVEQVWLPWLDDPQDAGAVEIGKQHKNLQKTLHAARAKLSHFRGANAARRAELLDDVLGFYGANAKSPPELPAEAVRRLKELGRLKPKYLRPGSVLNVPGLPPNRVRVYVLGPPKDYASLKQSKPKEGETYDHSLAFQGASASRFLSAVNGHSGSVDSEERQYPFHEPLKKYAGRESAALRKLKASYKQRPSSWRSIDEDWLDQVESLALFLDSYTNNSSLVLAFELVDSRKVLLFAADAQTGNWRSWSDIKWKGHDLSLEDILARTVLYKVGHHGSHNATHLPALEAMTNEDLMCLIPVHKKDPNIAKASGWKMPSRNLLRRLKEKSSNRVLQMDGDHGQGCDPAKPPARAAWKRAGVAPTITPLYMELVIRDE